VKREKIGLRTEDLGLGGKRKGLRGKDRFKDKGERIKIVYSWQFAVFRQQEKGKA